mmetsp:Transcript_22511/g.37755  ORF Transcript_22511/g.37755 Transcript_22511/m.37755 type:complete len:181 (+) Transcript_22511:332-874(+)
MFPLPQHYGDPLYMPQFYPPPPYMAPPVAVASGQTKQAAPFVQVAPEVRKPLKSLADYRYPLKPLVNGVAPSASESTSADNLAIVPSIQKPSQATHAENSNLILHGLAKDNQAKLRLEAFKIAKETGTDYEAVLEMVGISKESTVPVLKPVAPRPARPDLKSAFNDAFDAASSDGHDPDD